MVGIERCNTGIDYEAIAQAYGYKSMPEGFQEVEPVDVSIDWQTGADSGLAKQRASMKDFPHGPAPDHTIDEGKISTSKGDFSLKTQAWVHPPP